MNFFLQIFFLSAFFFTHTFSFAVARPNAGNNISFYENKGQWEKQVLYKARLDGGALFFEATAFTYHFYDKEKLRADHNGSTHSAPLIKSHAIKMNFKN